MLAERDSFGVGQSSWWLERPGSDRTLDATALQLSLSSLLPLSHWYTGPLHPALLDSHESHPWSLHTLAALGLVSDHPLAR